MYSPIKRVLTDDIHDAQVASRVSSGSNTVVPDDLATRLQNIGSRVRKCVNEGYATQRCASVPPTPHSSPAKPHASTPSPSAVPLFRSASDTLAEVFTSPSSSRTAGSPTPSPRKRGRAEFDAGAVPALDGEETDSVDGDDDAVMFILEAHPGRPIKPLKKSSSIYAKALRDGPQLTPFSVQVASGQCIRADAPKGRETMDLSDWFSQPF